MTELAVFDKQIRRAKAILEGWGGAVEHLQVPFTTREEIESFKRRVGLAQRKEGKPTIVMAEDTAVELGHPRDTSINLVLWTFNPELIEDRTIHLYGPDLDKTNGARLPYAQIILLALKKGFSVDPFSLESAQFLSNRLPGYMVRMLPGRLWVRVSRQALLDGLNFSVLGGALIAAYYDDFPGVEKAEVAFVTAGNDMVKEFVSIAAETKIIAGNNKKLTLVGDGEYECEDLNCDDCGEREVCDDIRDIIILRRKGKKE
ncbi:MAG: hypothetical protein JSU92_05940 [Deltaproteobacteria bacterium]|nr:MAG: hypothetical protein JSU92_05940 [Deltaproteobacteria bacterium]